MADVPDNNYVVGAGKIYFDQFVDDTFDTTGERYLGNTPALTLSLSIDKLDHYGSDYAVKVKDASITLQEDSTGSFQTDNIDADNLAMWFNAIRSTEMQAIAAAATETIDGVKLGRYYQIGRTDARPQGVGGLTAFTTLKVGAGTITALDNYTVDLARGRIYILPTSEDITEGDDIILTYDLGASTTETITTGGKTVIGAMRFIADNRAGDNRDYFWPYVKLTPNGDLALKGDTWEAVTFDFEVLLLNSVVERQYITRVVPAA